MKNLLTTFFVLSLLAAAATGQENKQVPKGIREADKAEAASEKNIPPPDVFPQRQARDVKSDADQLAKLTQSLQADLDSVSRGMLPRDLIPKLKRIEKLSKHLRNELSP